MMARMQITMDPELQRRVKDRADEMGVSIAEYFRRLAEEDLAPRAQRRDVSGFFNLGASQGGSVAGNSDRWLEDALEADHEATKRTHESVR